MKSAPDPLLVPTRKTPIKPIDLARAMLGAGLTMTHALVLLAQWACETGTGAHCYNWNLGNVKRERGRPFMMLKGVKEFLGGEWFTFNPPHAQTHFRAYESLEEGLPAFLEKLSGRYKSAIPFAEAGDLRGFVYALKSFQYFTAPVESYLALVTKCHAANARAVVAPLALEIFEATPTAADLAACTMPLTGVRAFQAMYNASMAPAGGPYLVTDGIAGPKTRAQMIVWVDAIQKRARKADA